MIRVPDKHLQKENDAHDLMMELEDCSQEPAHKRILESTPKPEFERYHIEDWLENTVESELLHTLTTLPLEDQTAITSRLRRIYDKLSGTNDATIKEGDAVASIDVRTKMETNQSADAREEDGEVRKDSKMSMETNQSEDGNEINPLWLNISPSNQQLRELKVVLGINITPKISIEVPRTPPRIVDNFKGSVVYGEKYVRLRWDDKLGKLMQVFLKQESIASLV
ncbi:UNVERIFIED_CONTAM: hypothetical protein K2H54_044872 [Gekko kuhli]